MSKVSNTLSWYTTQLETIHALIMQACKKVTDFPVSSRNVFPGQGEYG
jgi:hypothetical protein